MTILNVYYIVCFRCQRKFIMKLPFFVFCFRREVAALQSENYTLERQVFSYQRSISSYQMQSNQSNMVPLVPNVGRHPIQQGHQSQSVQQLQSQGQIHQPPTNIVRTQLIINLFIQYRQTIRQRLFSVAGTSITTSSILLLTVYTYN